MKYSFEAHIEAKENRRKIIDDNVNRAIKLIEETIDRTAKMGILILRLVQEIFYKTLIQKSKKKSLTAFLYTVIKLTGLAILLT